MCVIFKEIVLIIIFALSCFVTQGQPGFGPNDQDWGYVTIRDRAHMFWWLHYTTAVQDYTQRPLVIWLQGGPGGSSTGIGNFNEIGPWDVNQQSRNFSWVDYLNVLFVDNPVGTGFSYVEDASDVTLFARDNNGIADDFSSLLKGFLNEKSEFQQVPLYIFGQSYGGKMTADIALKLHDEIRAGNINCNFKGIGLGDAWISPIDSLVSWPSYLFSLGFIDTEGYDILTIVVNTAKAEIDAGHFERATAYFQATQIVLNRLTSVDYYNIMEPTKVDNSSTYSSDWNHHVRDQKDALRILKNLNIIDINIDEAITKRTRDPRTQGDENVDEALFNLMNGPVMEALSLKGGIPIRWGQQSENVFQAVNIDFMKPAVESVERILNETDLGVTVYNGQLDLIVSTPGTLNWVNSLKWPGANGWKKANRTAIVIDGINEGYSKNYGNFNFYWLNRAGHAAPTDNPSTMEYVLRETVGNYDFIN